MGNLVSALRKKPNLRGRTLVYPKRVYGEVIQNFCDNAIKTSKYEIWNFVFLNLFYQLQKLANFYFLLLSVITFFLGPASPVSAFTSLLPLCAVLLITMIKQGYEDYKRHISDNSVNNTPILILDNGKFVEKRWIDIKVGDVIQVRSDEEFPCDMFLISSDNDEGFCQITTANLDGETNIKKKFAHKETLEYRTPEELEKVSFRIEADAPCYDLYKFKGNVMYESRTTVSRQSNEEQKFCVTQRSILLHNLLLRGSKLKNNRFINGFVLYTGEDTKLCMNLKSKRNKVSIVDQRLNKFIIGMLGFLLFFSVLFVTLQSTLCGTSDVWYLKSLRRELSFINILVSLLSFLSVLNYVIPISLYVTLEVQKMLNTLFIQWDRNMWDEQSDTYAKANTSDIIEDLGQVEYVFSDKTGTLTENIMEFRGCYVNDNSYDENDGTLMDTTLSKEVNIFEVPELVSFFKILAICHTVLTEEAEDGKLKYMASSTDEKAFVEAAARLGIVFLKTEHDEMMINCNGTLETVKILNVLEFDTFRKRMSIIVKLQDGSIVLYCKGAESSILSRCSEGNLDATLSRVNDYSVLGLRTLVITYRFLSKDEYKEYKTLIECAQSNLEHRDEELAKVYDIVETKLIIAGATAVEDKLQENVSETIIALKNAGMKIWVLTGDKQETAINISLTCGHINESMHVFYLTSTGMGSVTMFGDVFMSYMDYIDHNKDKTYALVIDGHTLELVFNKYTSNLLEICLKCEVVLCCRMSPIQKAQIVKMVRTSKGSPITLAIGDGANDCSMLQEAHIGVGIIGKEGKQASMVGDFAFLQFQFLRQLLLVHGHYFYYRLSYTVIYFFYKNFLFTFPTIYHIIASGLSPVISYDDPMLTLFNLAFTSLPILVFGIIEKPFRMKKLYYNPSLYKINTKNSGMSYKTLIVNIIIAFIQASCAFLTIYLIYNEGGINAEEMRFSLNEYVTGLGHIIVVISIVQISMVTKEWNLPMAMSLVIAFVMMVLFYSIISAFFMLDPKKTFNSFFTLYNVLFNLFVLPQYWIAIFLIIGVSILPTLTFNSVKAMLKSLKTA